MVKTEISRSNEAAVALAVVICSFAATWWSLPAAWSENRTYGFVAAAFCIWLVWSERSNVAYEPSLDWGIAVLLALLSLGWFVAIVLSLQVLHQAAVPFILVAWVGVAFGASSVRVTFPIALTFMLGVPVWEILQGTLQSMTAAVNGVLVALFQLSATVDGNLIRFPFGTIEVAESCSGLSYFMTALTIGVVYARLFLHGWRARITAVATAVALAVVANWLRVFGLVLVGYRTKMQSPLMTEHGTYGWVIFALSLLIFFALTRTIEQLDRKTPLPQKSGAKATSPEGVAKGDGATDSIPLVVVSRRTRFVAATAAAVVGPILYFSLGALPSAPYNERSNVGIAPQGVWTLASSSAPEVQLDSLTNWAPAYKGAGISIRQRWRNGSTEIQLDRLVYSEHGQRAELISGENVIAPKRMLIAERTVGPLDDQFRVVREAIIRAPQGARVVWYWYRVADISTAAPSKAKLLELVTFISRGPPSELISLSAPCGPNDCVEATKSLFNLVTGRDMPSQSTP